MNTQPRRRFIKCCFCLTATGVGCSLLHVARRKSRFPGLQQHDPELESAILAKAGGPANIDPQFEPGYLKLHRIGELKRRGEALWSIMRECRLCPREDETKRLDGEEGECHATSVLEISSFHPHFGEERPLVGRKGSGTIFFSNCSLQCVFCINYQVSIEGQGDSYTVTDLAWMMLRLQAMGCHNINVVTPTHYSAHIVRALDKAAQHGLRIPLVYNTCGWERVDILQLLDGVVDIYLPDFKFWDGKMSAKYSSKAENYPEMTRAALLEMHRQVGVAKPAGDGLMYRGLMIRHLIMPNRVGGTTDIIKWISENFPKNTYLNLMSQYTPYYKASEYPEIARGITFAEYREAVATAKLCGLTNLDIQPFRGSILEKPIRLF